jgi:hypothetical protein
MRARLAGTASSAAARAGGLATASAAPVLARPRGPTSLSSVASPRRACCSCANSASPKWGVAKGVMLSPRPVGQQQATIVQLIFPVVPLRL